MDLAHQDLGDVFWIISLLPLRFSSSLLFPSQQLVHRGVFATLDFTSSLPSRRSRTIL